jgi:hypothetical protein
MADSFAENLDEIVLPSPNDVFYAVRDPDGTPLDRFVQASNLLNYGNLVTKTSAYTATASDHTIICNATSGSFTVTLPTAASHTGRIYHIKKIDSSGNIVTVDGNSSETIDDGATAILTVQYESISIQSDGTEWWIL